MAILDSVKTFLRISHSKLDDEITEQISAAQADMERAGVDGDVFDDPDNLVVNCIKSYVAWQMNMTNADLADGYKESYQYQLENLRKSSGYGGDVDE